VRTDNYRNEDCLFTDDEYIARVTRMRAEEAVSSNRSGRSSRYKTADGHVSADYDEVHDWY
jgi:hypothetical protein